MYDDPLSEQGEGIFCKVIYGRDKVVYEDVTEDVAKLEIENNKLEERRLHWWRLACRRFGTLCDLRELLKDVMFAHKSGWFDLDLLDKMKEAIAKEQ